MELFVCQSCAMPMKEASEFATHADGSQNTEYCIHCLQNGEFTTQETMEEMIETCIPFTLQAGVYKDEATARASMLAFFPSLKRWSEAE